MSLSRSRLRPSTLVLKRVVDVGLAAAGLIALLPLLLMIASIIKIDSRGPILFKQRRLGEYGREFTMLKFRTMTVGAEDLGTGLFSYENDPRVTRVGHVLRRYSLDELPQLWNVLYGVMSIVGPRPPVSYELGPYEDFTPEMRIRFTVKPGITGLAQVSGRNDLTWPEKIVHDNEYLKRLSRHGVLEDLRIIWATIRLVVSAEGVIEPRRASVEQT